MGTGYGLTDVSCLSCSEASVRAAVSLSPCSSRYTYKALSLVKIVSLKSTSRGMAFVCRADSNGYTKNPIFSSRNKHVFTHFKSKKNEDRHDSDSLEKSELFPSKNGPSLSVASASKSKVNGPPSKPREEEEIVNFYREIEAQFRRMPKVMEEKKRVEVQGCGAKESESGHSLFKLVREYINPTGKTCSNNVRSRGDFLHGLEQDGRCVKEKNSSSPKLARKHVTPIGKKTEDFFLDAYKLLDGSFDQEKSKSSAKLSREHVTATRKKSSSGGRSSSVDFLDQSEQGGLFEEEKTASTVKLARKHIVQIGESSSSKGRSRDFLDESVQDGLFNKEKSTSSFDSNNVVEQESPFLKFLSEHTTPIGNKSKSNASRRGFILDQSDSNGAFNKEKNTTSFDSNGSEKFESPPVSRPVSNFRRRSPIPRVKFQLIRTNAVTDSSLYGKRVSTLLEHEKREHSSDFGKSYIDDQVEKQKMSVDDNLSAMKLPELRALAKSRGMKGFSRLKKQQLLELLLCGGSG